MSDMVLTVAAVTECPAVERFEVIDHTTPGTTVARSLTHVHAIAGHGMSVALSLQDGGRTLKIFLSDPEPPS